VTLDRGGFDDVTRAQQLMWSRGDFHRIGVSQVAVGELLARALHIHAGERVLDVQPKLAARVRLLNTGQVNKNDPNDARSVALARCVRRR